MGGARLLDRGTVRGVGPVRAAEPGRRLATLHPGRGSPGTLLPRRLPTHAPLSAGPRKLGFQARPWCRLCASCRPGGEQLMPPGVLQGGPRAAPALLRGLPSRGGRQSQAQPCPGVHLLWPLLWGLACWGAVGTRPRCLRGRVRLAPRRLLGPQTSSRLQQADTVSSGVWRPGAGLRGQGSGSGSQGSCLGLRSSPAQTTDPGFSPASHQRKSRWLGGSHSKGQGPQRSGAPHPVEGGANPPLRDWVDDRLLGRPPFHFRRWAVLPGADTPACRANLAHCLSV